MGADSFHAFYAIKIPIDPNDEEALTAFEEETNPLFKTAQRVGLHTYVDRMTDGEDYFCYVGYPIGSLGLEYETHVEMSVDELVELASEVRQKLEQGGFEGVPTIHFQLIAQY
ncbi:MAG: hypothetical protein JWP89_6495 [Schlesneria sp.]|nr:hypothetical protein [Schlesneria sp.]